MRFGVACLFLALSSGAAVAESVEPPLVPAPDYFKASFEGAAVAPPRSGPVR